MSQGARQGRTKKITRVRDLMNLGDLKLSPGWKIFLYLKNALLQIMNMFPYKIRQDMTKSIAWHDGTAGVLNPAGLRAGLFPRLDARQRRSFVTSVSRAYRAGRHGRDEWNYRLVTKTVDKERMERSRQPAFQTRKTLPLNKFSSINQKYNPTRKVSAISAHKIA
jgi:hypothetical protein